MQGITNKIPDRKKKGGGYFLHPEVDWNLKETVISSLKKMHLL